jgi:hypothetical protein
MGSTQLTFAPQWAACATSLGRSGAVEGAVGQFYGAADAAALDAGCFIVHFGLQMTKNMTTKQEDLSKRIRFILPFRCYILTVSSSRSAYDNEAGGFIERDSVHSPVSLSYSYRLDLQIRI